MGSSAPQRGRLRRTVALFHRWLGLVLGAFAVFVGLTGSLIVFQPEIDRWLSSDLHFVEPSSEAAPLERVLAVALAAHPWGPPSFANLRLPREAGRSASVLMKDRFGAGSHPFHEAFVDPGSGRLLGHRAPQDTLVGFLVGLHTHLLMGEHSWGETVVGLIGVVLILFCASGLYMWWPRRGGLRGAVSVRAGQGSYWFNYDLHKLTGAIMVLPLLAAGLTGIVLVFPGYVRPPLKAVIDAPPPPRAPRSEAVPGGSPITVDRAVALARGAVPEGVPTSAQVPQGAGTGTIQVRMRRVDDRRQHYADGGVLVHVDRYSGAVRAIFRSEDRPVGGRLLHEWILPTHNGEIAGIAGRVTMLIGGLAPAGLFATGLFLWLRRRRLRRERRAGRMQAAAG